MAQENSLFCGPGTEQVDAQCQCTAENVAEDSRLQDTGKIYMAVVIDHTNFDWAQDIVDATIAMLQDTTDGLWDDIILDSPHINGSLPELVVISRNSECDEDTAVQAYWQVRPVHGIIGCRCSGASIQVARVAELENVAQISPVSTSIGLNGFDTFTRLIAPDDIHGEVGALQAMFDLFEWDTVTILSTDLRYAQDITSEFRKSWQEAGNVISFSDTFRTTADGDVDIISVDTVIGRIPTNPGNSSRIIVLAAHDQHAYDILRRANALVFQPDTVWIGLSWAGTSIPNNTSWMPEFPGYLGMTPHVNRNTTALDFLGRLQSIQASQDRTPWNELSHYAMSLVADSIVAMTMALVSLPPSQRQNGTAVTEQLRSQEFEGVSGRVAFTEQGWRRDPVYTVYNMQRGNDGVFSWVPIGSTGTTVGSTSIHKSQTICYAVVGCGDIDSKPTDTYPLPPEPTDGVALWVLVVIPVMSAFLVFLIICYWRSKRNLESELDEAQKRLQQLRNIDDELTGLDTQLESAKRRQNSLILQRGRLEGLPKTWNDSTETLVSVEDSDPQYWSVLERLQTTMPDAYIAKLWRVQNKELWSYYVFHKGRIGSQKVPTNEQLVWHGTSDLDPAVIYNDRQDGFMMHFSRGGFWGRGIYFAENSSYSSAYAFKPKSLSTDNNSRGTGNDDEREMFLTRLIVGQDVNMGRDGSPNAAAQCATLTVPPINPITGLKYNTVSGMTAGSRVFVVYENGRAYPDYLIRFYQGERDERRSLFKSKEEASKRNLQRAVPETAGPFSTLSRGDLPADANKHVTWEFEEKDDEWKPYSASDQRTLENAHQTNSSKANIYVDPWDYEIDLRAMTQKNVMHPDGRVRRIRRLASFVG